MKQKVALVLSGGGARGIAHIGVIEELLARGYDISSVAGTSMGSVVGGMYAMGKLEEFKQWVCSLDRRKVVSLVDFSLGHQGLVKADKVLKTIKEYTGEANIEDLSLPYAAVAADIINRKEVVFRKGDIFKAIRASIAIPSVITPVKTNTGVLVDGGVMNNIPVNHVERVEGDLLVVVNVNASVPLNIPTGTETETKERKRRYQEKIKEFHAYVRKVNPLHSEEKLSYINLVSRTINLMIYNTAKLHLEQYNPDLMIEVSSECCGMYDFYKADELVEIGRIAAIKALDAK